jgi:gliding motility-associated-like protein
LFLISIFLMKSTQAYYPRFLILILLFFSGMQVSNAAIQTYLQEIESCPDIIFSMPVYVENLNGVDSFNLVFEYDPEVLQYSGFENIHPDLLQGNFNIDHLLGKVTMTFNDAVPLIIGDDVLVAFRFNAIAGSSAFTWDLLESAYYFEGVIQESDFYDGYAEVLPEINISLVQIPDEVCPGSFDASVIATITGGTPPYTYQWIGSPIQVLSDSIARNLATDGSYTLRITDDKGCMHDTTFTVETMKLNEIEISASPDTVFISNPTITFTAENLSDPFITNYFWRFGDGDSINTPNPTVPKIYFGAREFAKEGGQEYEITLTVTNEFGCDTTLTYTLLLREAPIFIPNVFTPNGDGANDEFKIVRDDDKDKIISEEYLRLELVVFNRWGRKIYSSDNYRSDWDGGNAPDGVYFYVLNAIGFYKIDIYKGAVHILR